MKFGAAFQATCSSLKRPTVTRPKAVMTPVIEYLCALSAAVVEIQSKRPKSYSSQSARACCWPEIKRSDREPPFGLTYVHPHEGRVRQRRKDDRADLYA